MLSSKFRQLKIYLGDLAEQIIISPVDSQAADVAIHSRLLDLENHRRLGQCQIRRFLVDIEQLLKEEDDVDSDSYVEEDEDAEGYLNVVEAFDDGYFDGDK